VGQDVCRVVAADELGVGALEVLSELLLGEGGGGGFAGFVLEFGLAGQVEFLAEGLVDGQVGEVVVLLVLLAVAQAVLVVGDGAVGLGLISHLTII
jgi:hypothetical protein